MHFSLPVAFFYVRKTIFSVNAVLDARCVCAHGYLASVQRVINICFVNEWEADYSKIWNSVFIDSREILLIFFAGIMHYGHLCRIYLGLNNNFLWPTISDIILMNIELRISPIELDSKCIFWEIIKIYRYFECQKLIQSVQKLYLHLLF